MTSQRLWIFRLFTLAVAPVVLLGTLEAGLRLVGAGHSSDFTVASTVDGVASRRENARFSWQFFPIEIARGPLVLSFPTEKAEDTYRIFVLGGSAAQGDPEPTFGFSRILQLMLERRHPGVRFEVINAAVTAINSHVVYQIARELQAFDGDLFILYLGNNEVVGPYGAGTVFAPLSPNLSFIRSMIHAKQTRLGQTIAQLASRLRPDSEKRERWGGMEMFLEQQIRADDPRMEDVYRHFRANLEDTLRVVRRAGARVIVSTVGTNLQDSAPFASLHSPSLPQQSRTRFAELFQRALLLTQEGHLLEAGGPLLAAEKLDATHAGLQFLLARHFQALGERDEAMRRYRLARDLDALRFRADSRIDRIIRDVGSDRSDDGIHLVDGAGVLESAGGETRAGVTLFRDHVHMNFEGNYRLARALAAEVDAMQPQALHRSGGERHPFPSLEECRDGLALTDFDRLRITREMLQRIQRPPFSNQLDHEDTLQRLRAEEEALRQASLVPGALPAATNRYERALRRRDQDPWLHYNFGMLLYSTAQFEAAIVQLRALLSSLPHHAVARERLLAALMQTGRFEEAASEAREALRIEPDFHGAKYSLAHAYSQIGRGDDAIALYDELARDDPKRAVDTYNQLGRLHLEMARPARAVEAFRKAVEISREPGHGSRPDLLYHLGLALKRDGRTRQATRAFAEAIAGYEEQIRESPGSALLHFNLGQAHLEMRDPELAARSFRAAAVVDPTNLQAHISLAQSLVAMGRPDEARASLAAASEELARLGRAESSERLRRFRAELPASEAPPPREAGR